MTKTEQSISELQDDCKSGNKCVMGIPEIEDREKGTEKYLHQ